MRTTLNIDDRILSKAALSVHAKTKTETISKALKEILKKKEISRIKNLSGKIRVYDNWKKLETLELKEAHR